MFYCRDAYPPYDNCKDKVCPYRDEKKCYLAELETFETLFNKFFPNVKCYVDDGCLQIHFDIQDNADKHRFNDAGTLCIWPSNGGEAIVVADVMDYDDPTKDVPRVHPGQCPVQKYMIDPERFVW